MSQLEGRWPQEIVAHRRFILGLARLQLGNEADAEDVVQETLIAAAQSWSSYSAQTPVRAWLTGILKHKIVDALRGRIRRQQTFVSIDEAEGSSPWPDFTPDGRWDPATFLDHSCPQSQASQAQLLGLVQLCLQALPERSAQLLLMREFLGLESEEIVATAGVSAGNLRVILHRARMQLRRCVVASWGEQL